MTTPVRDSIDLRGGAMALLRWPAADKPRLVFAHANGFCASAYKQLLSPLAGRFDIVAMDLRGHGRTTLAAEPATHAGWDIYAEDIAALCDGLDRPPDLLAGHSMGAAASLMAAARLPDAPPLALVEPVVLHAWIYAAYRTPLRAVIRKQIGMGELARRRANGWPDRDSVAARYRARPAFADWAPGVVEDYLEDGLVEAGGEMRLACDPEWEAANFEAQRHDVLRAARRIGPRARILKAERRSTVWNANGLAARNIPIDILPGAGHLAPMSAPGAVADWIAETAARLGL